MKKKGNKERRAKRRIERKKRKKERERDAKIANSYRLRFLLLSTFQKALRESTKTALPRA